MDKQIKTNIQKITELLEIKNVSVMDDLIQDIFVDDKTNEKLFYAQKLDERSPLDVQLHITNRIIEKLEIL